MVFVRLPAALGGRQHRAFIIQYSAPLDCGVGNGKTRVESRGGSGGSHGGRGCCQARRGTACSLGVEGAAPAFEEAVPFSIAAYIVFGLSGSQIV
jgi:hypothetical protein